MKRWGSGWVLHHMTEHKFVPMESFINNHDSVYDNAMVKL
jgi:hypothetical protein